MLTAFKTSINFYKVTSVNWWETDSRSRLCGIVIGSGGHTGYSKKMQNSKQEGIVYFGAVKRATDTPAPKGAISFIYRQ